MDTCGRLLREIKENAKNQDDTEISLRVKEESLFKWEAVISGPPDSPFEGYRFRLSIDCPSNYPLSSPEVSFVTPVFHPNVKWSTGEICLDVLKNNWTPAWTLHYVCRAIIALLGDPNADSPLNCDAGNLVRSGDVRGYNSLARMYVIDFGIPTDE
ncbi:putative ubiquitin-conjugating enzyme E2 [Gregarina niphandrodes]|uniref:Ubiquitin-conjugating enzyme E2 n=1 Tax=Gregarina niphandrodes TaxID=110365 RepID=A0A023B352_GRENI|nr:putative ubiquitin-conjugating enzyme E2 [Gregarina niphandrodes]EZG55322.1 putative ubiquitin-conjugating enzyme E2 [Gregarina niphandrodes]|eukprot:XP_011131645.1 putative ubiquitin-conjugating enzyme E2 [Gregarina niphandrodes]